MSEKILQEISAAFNTVMGGSVPNIWESSTYVDKMNVPSEYLKQVSLCRYFYSRDPIAAGTINKQVEIAFNNFVPRQGDCSDEEFGVYSHINVTCLEALRDIALEYLISGLIVPEIAWKQVTGKELGLKNRPNKRYFVPDYIWLRPAENLVIRPTPIPKKVRIFVQITGDDVYFIQSGGKYTDGTEDKELYRQMVKDYPDYVKKVKDGQTEFELPDAFVLRRKVQAGSIFPTPYLLPALESLQHKRNLKKMDYSIAARVIGAIMLVRLGDKDFPLTEDDKDSLDNIKEQMLWRGQANNLERVFQLFGNHTLQIDWIYPDTKALLDDTKYVSVNNDILHALGIPNIITVGENMRTASSQAEFALLPPTETLSSLRNELLPVIQYVFNQIKEKNHFDYTAKPALAPIRLYDPAKMATVGETLYNNGALSKTTWDLLTITGLEFEDELIQRKADDDLTKELGLEPTPQVPFSSPAIGQPGGTKPQAPKPGTKPAKPAPKTSTK